MIKSSVMKKSITIICVLFALLAGNLPVSAQYVTQEAAREKANAFLKRSANSQSAARKAPRKAPMLTLANNRDEFYVFNDETNGGYVVISGEERMPDVLAFSFEDSIDPASIPCNMQAWMDDCAAQVRWLREHPEVATERRKSPQRADIAPMLTCKFSQGYPYNLKCPVVDGEHCVTGCVATAMAQIMHYWQWPKKTTFTIPAYTTRTLKIEMPAIPPTTIDWDNILEEYRGEYSQEQKDAIATLMALCGTAVIMDYTKNSSGSAPFKSAYELLDYDIDSMQELLYRSDCLYRSDYSDADWEEMLYNELNNRRPINYGGTSAEGHAFVIDGYQYLDETAYWHVNWGWGGSYIVAGPYCDQQYYTLDNMGFNNNQHALIGIQPASNGRLYIVDEADGKATLYYDLEAGSKGDKARAFGDGIGGDVTEVELHPSVANYKPKSLRLFAGCNNLKQIKGIEYLNTEEMTDVSWMFSGCSNLTSLDVSSFKTENVTNMNGMFNGCSNLTSLDVSGFKTDKVTDMSWMFSGCDKLTSLDLSKFNTENVANMSYMFSSCSNLTNLDLSGFKTDNVTTISSMFSSCSNLTNLDVSGFKTDKVTNMRYMFSGCSNLTTIYASNLWDMSNVTYSDGMFFYCRNLVGGAGTTFDRSHTNGEYARIDEGKIKPGYFTYKEYSGIETPLSIGAGASGVYNLGGAKVRSAQEGANGLPSGLYIVNKKKILVK